MPPANGTVIVSSSAYIEGTAAGIFRCSISLTNALDNNAYQNVSAGCRPVRLDRRHQRASR